MANLIDSYGLVVLFLVVGLESAGVWVPGETALITAAVLASRGHFPLAAVIVIAAAAAILGDNAGYWIGRLGGRRLLERWRRLAPFSERILPRSERFFRRHGAKTVFVARFVAVLRVTGAWMAGVSHMPWWRFLVWNALGGIVWAAAMALIAFYLGRAAADAVSRYGLLGGAVVVVLTLIAALGYWLWKRRLLAAEGGQT